MTRLALLVPVAAIAALSALGACSPNALGEKEARCDKRAASNLCTDWHDYGSADNFGTKGDLCTLGGEGVFARGELCDITGAVGGCRATGSDGTKETSWYYKSESYPDADTVKGLCDQSGRQFVAQ